MNEMIKSRPNVYKCMMGLMDMTYKEMASYLERNGLFRGDVSEICRAVRGLSGPKHDLIRSAVIKAFTIWLKESTEETVPLELRTFANQMKPFITI